MAAQEQNTPVYEISFKKRFSCAMGDCPNTCCKGWRIAFDDGTYRRYLEETGKNGIRLRSSIKKSDGEVCFRTSLKSCTFYDRDGLCNLQRTIGTDYMPLVCRTYPRYWQHYGTFAEEALFLSCPQAAKLFLEHLNELEYVATDRSAQYQRWGTNEEPQFLEWLCALRVEMIKQLNDRTRTLRQILSQLNALMHELQARIIHGDRQPDFKEIMQRHNGCEPFAVSSVITDQMITCGFYHRRLKRVSPVLYELCREYFRRFDCLSAAEAEALAAQLREKMYAHEPWMDQVFRGYVIYHLQMFFLEVYEDYSFVKKMGMEIMHMHILELLLALYADAKKSLTRDTLAVLLSVYERRGRHNQELAELMYEKLYPALEAMSASHGQDQSFFL